MKTTFFALMAFAGALMGETSSVVVSFDTNSAKMSSVNTKQLIRAGNSAITGITAMPFVSVGPDSWSFYPYGTNLFTALDEGVSQRGKPGYPTHFKLAGTTNAVVDGRYIIPTGSSGYYSWGPVVNTNTWGSAVYASDFHEYGGNMNVGLVVRGNGERFVVNEVHYRLTVTTKNRNVEPYSLYDGYDFWISYGGFGNHTWGVLYTNDTRKYLATGSLQPVDALVSFIGFGYGGNWTNMNPVEFHQRVMNNWRETMGVRFDLEFKGWTVSGTVSNEISLVTSTHVTVVMADTPPMLYMRQNHYPELRRTDTILYWQVQNDEYGVEEANGDGTFRPIEISGSEPWHVYNVIIQGFAPPSTNPVRLFRLWKR
ncbi:MAG: hypothetical protein A3G52_00965 [Candidatus Taylorbacteria bacterium RIFCSPLOWO2_12_FULL_43_20]|uniref:Uncharacterized protein n=1 Tax=Candidatus Taylorbacteria bacterium RIFCSPLOWO2_12_FULL_43_20 TaxID=1802332 RepID=A0A1G2P058_9BACT|nr:MAG: hypothetical protein A2825_01385 [Candidatus Taylorbacteria bacterium RIFCSPHIGHO2_01_FULL_43_120]OHA41698.1 MAG: hypothetical protein A3G52_00965 [Candidatus Taylorbacteria bacterium RIFCSPLOWO2_12_FULL_43_20]